MIDKIQKSLLLHFPSRKFSVHQNLDTLGIAIAYDAYARPGEAKKIEAYVEKIMTTQYEGHEYTVQKMPF